MAHDTLYAIGEALIDMIPSKTGCSFAEVPSFSPRVGGAPANVCGAYARLGGASALLTSWEMTRSATRSLMNWLPAALIPATSV